MRVVIIGGGKVGGYVARELFTAGHAVAVVEREEHRAQQLGEDTGALVIRGDGTDLEILSEAGVGRSDWVIAVTGQDETNLVACELSSTLGADRSLARLNDPRNRATFAALHIPVVAVTDLIGEVIERELDREQLRRITMFGGGAISVIEVEVPAEATPRAVRDLPLPPDALVITVIDPEGIAAVPGGGTVIRAGDRVVAVTALDREPLVRDALRGGRA